MAAGEVVVFDILKRQGKVFTVVVNDNANAFYSKKNQA